MSPISKTHGAPLLGPLFLASLAAVGRFRHRGRKPDLRCAWCGGQQSGTMPTLAAMWSMAAFNWLQEREKHFGKEIALATPCNKTCTRAKLTISFVSATKSENYMNILTWLRESPFEKIDCVTLPSQDGWSLASSNLSNAPVMPLG